MLKALIAEKNTLMRAGMAACVPWASLNIVLAGQAEDSAKARTLYRQYRPDLLILDLSMPGGAELLREIRAEDARCGVILLADQEPDGGAAEAGKPGITELLVGNELKDGDFEAAVERVSALLQPGIPVEMDRREQRKTAAWQDFLFGKGCVKLPFRAVGITAFRLFDGRETNPMLHHSLTEMILQEIGRPEVRTRLEQNGCQVIIWKEPPEQHLSETALYDVLRYARETCQVRTGCISMSGEPNGILLPAIARSMVSMLRDPVLFDDPVVHIDGEGRYRHERLDSLRHEFDITQPICWHRDSFTELKTLLDRYPGALDGGLDQAAAGAEPLLSLLGIRETPGGLAEMTGRICGAAEIRLKEEIPACRPKIREAMDTIHAHLAEHLSREELSRSVHYDSAYFSRLFQLETGMSYIEYLYASRMLRARTLVGETEMSFNEIARAVGFPNTSYFFKRFRQFCGMTPNEWRKMSQEKNKST